jgi:hypothetical protein
MGKNYSFYSGNKECGVVAYSQEVPSPWKLKFIWFQFSGTTNMFCLYCKDRKKLDEVQFIV